MVKNRKGMSLGDLAPAAIAFVFIAVVVAVGSDVLGDIQSDYVTGAANCNASSTSACGVAYNTTGNGLTSLDTLSGWLPTIALVVAAAIVIGVLAFFKQ